MMKTTFGELLVDHGDGRGAVIHLFVAQPTPLEEKNLGKIFALIEFTETFPFAEEVIQYVDDNFFQSYYRSADFEPEAAFERSLHKVNTAVQELISQHGEGWVYKTNIALGVFHQTTLHLSYVGKVEAYLAQSDTMVDIVQPPAVSEIQPLKLFNNIISGKCPERGAIIVATSTLLDYLSLEKIRRTVQEQSPAEAVQFFETLLSEHDTLSNVGAFIVKLERGQATQPEMDALIERKAFTDGRDSMAKLIGQERATGDLLTPSIWPSLKGKLKNIAPQATPERPGAKAAVPKRAATSQTAKPQSPAWQYAKVIGQGLIRIALYIVSVLVIIGKKIWEWLRRFFKNPDSLSASLGGSMYGVAGWWRRLTLPRKLFLVLFALTLIIFVISVLGKDQAVEKDEQAAQYAQTITEVQNALGEVESKQIMKDDAGARAGLAKAEALLATVPTDSAAYQVNGTQLKQTMDTLNATLNKVEVLAQLTVAADFNTVTDAVSVGHMTKIGNNIFGFADGSQTVYRANLADQSVSSVITGADSALAYRAIENDSAATTLAVTAADTFVQFNPVLEKTSAVTVNVKDKISATDFDIFTSRLYILDAKNKKILRLEKTADAYGQSEVWMNTPALEQAAAFDIDASIYVLFKDGAIKKYDAGEESEFTVDTFSPSLGGATVIRKPDLDKPLYVLNPTTQRVVILEPDGSLRTQYTHPDFASAQDLLVDEDNQLLYILGNNIVWSISLK